MRTAAEWIATAVRMQKRANAAALFGQTALVLAYCRHRDFCARMAARLGAGDVWGPISNEAGRVVC